MKAMDKFNELKAAAMAATPGPWEWFTSNSMARLSSTPSGKDGDVLSAFRASDGVPCVSVSQRDMAFIATANPAVILALLAELEAKDERIAELEAEVKVWESAALKHLSRAEEAEKRLPILEQDKLRLNEIINSEANRADAAEKRLATPVRLVAYRNSPDMHTKQYYEAIGFNQGIDACSVAVRTAGFTVEGDE